MDARAYLQQSFAQHDEVARATEPAIADAFEKLLTMCAECIRARGKILFFGNGGSAADAQNFATELAVRFVNNRIPIAALALTTDTSVLTAVGNDFGFEHLFSRQVEALGRAGDVAIGISTSGRSPNVIKALQTAKEMNIVPAAFGGGSGGDLADLADPLILIPSTTTARIQEMHIAVGQMLCGALEIELGLV